jgi:hypothetical protein
MSDCECLAKCIFFNNQMANMPAAAEAMKKQYCQSGHQAECARYIVFKALGRENVPKDLFPSEKERAKTILTNNPGA